MGSPFRSRLLIAGRNRTPLWAFSSSDKQLGLTLSNSDRAAVGTGNGGRGTAARSAGNWYLEFFCSNKNGVSHSCGIATAAATLGGAPGADAFGYGYVGEGGNVIHSGGVGLPTYATYTTGDTIGVAINSTAQKIWFAKNGVWQGSSDPSNNVGGVALDPGAYYPMIYATGAWTIPYPITTYEPPAGFSIW